MSLSRSIFLSSALMLLPFAAVAQAPAKSDTPITREELPGLVREAIMNDPDVVMDALKKMREQMASEAQKEMENALQKHKETLLNDTASPSVGPKTADVTVIEFFDYHCGYCKQVLPSISKLIENDKKVRVIFREFPILSEDSVAASRAALAVNRIAPDKYFAYHTALMNTKGKYTEEVLFAEAKKLGIDTEKLKKEMASQEVTAMLDQTRDMAADIGIRGTPAMIINGEIFPGAIPYDDLVTAVNTARSAKPGAEKPKE